LHNWVVKKAIDPLRNLLLLIEVFNRMDENGTSSATTKNSPLMCMARQRLLIGLLQWRDNALVAAHPSGKSLHSPGDRFSIFQEVDGGVVNNSSSLHHLAQIFRLRKLAGPLQDIPLEKNDEFIGVRGVAEKLSSSGTIGLAGDTVCIKR
jgi:hypothetical protein